MPSQKKWSHMFSLRTSARILLLACSLLLSSCASINELGSSRPANDWDSVPQTYIDGLTLARKGDAKKASELFEQTIKEQPGFSPAYTNLGLQKIALNDLAAAEKIFHKSISITPENPVSIHYLGVILRMRGEFSGAKEMYEKAIGMQPNYAVAHLNLGILLDIYLFDFENALQHYEKYQSLVNKKDVKVAKWIIDLQRRIKKNKES